MAANSIQARLARITHPQLEADTLALTFMPPIAESAPMLRVTADRLLLKPIDRTLREVVFECAMTQVVADTDSSAPAPPETDAALDDASWRCRGPLRWHGGSGWEFSVQANAAFSQAEIHLFQGNSDIGLTLPLGEQSLAVRVHRGKAAWLQSWLPQMKWQKGRIDGRLESGATTSEWKGSFDISGLSAESPDGTLALADLALAGPLQLELLTQSGMRIDARPVVSRGEVLAAGIYLAWPQGSQAKLEVLLAQAGKQWRLDPFRIADTGFDASGSMDIEPGTDEWLRALSARFEIDLARRYERYVEGWMASLGQSGLQAAGSISGSIAAGIGGGIETVDARLSDVALAHPQGRYRISGLNGDFAFRRNSGASAPSDLRWRELTVDALAFGAGSLKAVSADAEIRATQPVRLGLFAGSVVVSDLVYRPLATRGDRVRASMDLADVDVGRMATAFGWPAFSGRLAGRFPQIRYADDVLGAGGEIVMQVFDGEVRVSGLSIERPFGVAPALSAGIVLKNLDLQPMTDVFGFGRIEGRLEGEIAGLRLLDWRPTAFDARLRTVEKGRRRISQLAVAQLTQIGGGGGVSGLQGRLMGAFDSFGYRRIGLSCKLANSICEMGGVDDSAGGYTILQGSGLPLITIRGFQRRVDWPVLVERLKVVASGQRPVVE